MMSKMEVNINPYSDDWTTGDLLIMTDEQVLKSLHYTINQLNKTIRALKKHYGAGLFLDDVVRQEVSNLLLIEIQKRWFKREVIPVKQ